MNSDLCFSYMFLCEIPNLSSHSIHQMELRQTTYQFHRHLISLPNSWYWWEKLPGFVLGEPRKILIPPICPFMPRFAWQITIAASQDQSAPRIAISAGRSNRFRTNDLR